MAADSSDSKMALVKPIAAVIMLIVAIAILVWYFRTPKVELGNLWYWDPATSTLVAAKDQLSPAVPNGSPAGTTPTLLRAYVFTCGDCKNRADLNVAYIEKFSDETKSGFSSYTTLGSDQGTVLMQAQVKRTGDADWVSATSDEGVEIRKVNNCSDGSAPKPCEGP